jgi:hypothetical protein
MLRSVPAWFYLIQQVSTLWQPYGDKNILSLQGTLKDILKIIETDFNDELSWKLEGYVGS